MKQIRIENQSDFDNIKEVKADEEITVACEVTLDFDLPVFGKIRFEKKILHLKYSRVVARENSSVEAWGNSSVVAWENSSVVAWGNSSVVARGNSSVRAFSPYSKIILWGFSVAFKELGLKVSIEKKSKTSIIQEWKLEKYFDREGIEVKDGICILFKKVSENWKTQENTENETLWVVGSTVEHPAWNPNESECGEGKFHACSRPYFCDEFRSKKGDRYVAIEVNVSDTFEWENPTYIHKIAFKKCRVLYECNKKGQKL